ncbi:MAG: hypothetical protein M1832_000309 [Thelocarpon impressellum]|nr:MAG: hypothetical protein M1832_000309 [Thelocarpon impressellum]
MADPSAALDKTVTLLRTKDDTSRFVGLALLKSLLDSQQAVREDPDALSRCWAAISPSFLDRLLRATESEKTSRDDANGMLNLAVAVIHTFTVLLPADVRGQAKLVGRAAGLIGALVISSPQTTTQILQTLLTFSSRPRGAVALWHVDDMSPLVEIAPQQPLSLDVIRYMILHQPVEEEDLTDKLHGLISALVLAFRDGNAHVLFHFLAEVLPEAVSKMIDPSPRWLAPLTKLLQETITSRPSAAAREASTLLAATLFQTFPSSFPSFLFRAGPQETDSPSFISLFMNLNLIDIRTTIPSLMELLASTSYQRVSRRLSASYTLLSAFIAFLLSLEADDDAPLPMTPDTLLKFRRDISETLSLTIEFLRDRYDAAVTGAAGLHPDTPKSAPGAPLALTWDTPDGRVADDPLILAAVRALALWLRADDNEALRKEAAGVTDVLLGLYGSSTAKSPEASLGGDFCSPVLIALEGILSTPEGIAAFASHNGWALLSKHLSTLLASILSSPSMPTTEVDLAHSILDTLSTLTTTSPTTLSQLTLLSTASSLPVHSSPSSLEHGCLRLDLLSLCATLLTRAPRGLQKRHRSEAASLAHAARAVQAEAAGRETEDGAWKETWSEAGNVASGLEGLL